MVCPSGVRVRSWTINFGEYRVKNDVESFQREALFSGAEGGGVACG